MEHRHFHPWFGWLFIFFLICAIPESARSQPKPVTDDLYDQAVAGFMNSEMDEAYALFLRLSDVYLEQERWEELIEVQGYKGLIKIDRRNFDHGRELAERMRDTAGQYLDENHLYHSMIYILKAYLEKESLNLDEALHWAEKSVENIDNPDQKRSLTVRSNATLGYMLYNSGKYEAAIEAYLEGLSSARLMEDERESYYYQHLINNYLGVILCITGEPAAAMRYYEENQRYLEYLYHSEHPEHGKSFNNIGSVHFGSGDFGLAAEYFIRAAGIFISNFGSHHQMVAEAYNNAGTSYLKLARLEEAADYLERAQDIKISLLGPDHLDTAVGYTNLASVFMAKDDFASALDSYNLSLSIRKSSYGDGHPGMIRPYLKRGKLYLKMNNPYLALADFRNALSIGSEIYSVFHPDIAEIFIQAGLAFRAIDDFDVALENYQQAIIRLSDFFYNTDIHVNPDKIYSSHPMLLLEALSAKADLMYEYSFRFQDQAYLETSYRTYMLSLQLIEDLQLNFQYEISKLNLIREYSTVYEDALLSAYRLYELTGDSGYKEGAFNIIERGKSRIASELLHESRAREFAGVPEDVVEYERTMSSDIASLNQRLNLELEKGDRRDENLVRSLRDSLFQSQASLNDWIGDLETKYPSYYKMKYNPAIPDLDDVREKLLAEGQTALNYLLGDQHIFLMVISRDKTTIHQLDLGVDLSTAIDHLKSALKKQNSPVYRRIASELYQNLVEPVEERIRDSSELLIVPDHLLHYLPFELLLSEDSSSGDPGEWAYMIRDYRFSYAPSLNIYNSMRNQNSFNENRLFGFAPYIDHQVAGYVTGLEGADHPESEQADADPLFFYAGFESGPEHTAAGSPVPLPITRYEIEEIARIFQQSGGFLDIFRGGREVTLLLNEEANFQNLKNKDLSDYGYLHFATHAFVHEETPALSGIGTAGQTSGTNVLFVNEIYNMEFNADLIVLSGCETGLGTLARGEGLIGFTRAFLYSGARNLLVSLWKVNERPTSELMVRFYREMMDGAEKNEALRIAKLSMIEHPSTAFPSNWASFILIGR